jgi:hypothetical protein
MLPDGSFSVLQQKTMFILTRVDFASIAGTGGAETVCLLDDDGTAMGTIPVAALDHAPTPKSKEQKVSWADIAESDHDEDERERVISPLPTPTVQQVFANPEAQKSPAVVTKAPPGGFKATTNPWTGLVVTRTRIPLKSRTPASDVEWNENLPLNKTIRHPRAGPEWHDRTVTFNRVRFGVPYYRIKANGSMSLETDHKVVQPPVSVVGARQALVTDFQLFP